MAKSLTSLLKFGNEKTCEQIYNFVKNNSFEESSVTWPRHADGSCDYDGSKKNSAAQTAKTSTTNVSPNAGIEVYNEKRRTY